jgi:ribosomal protein S7
MQQLKNNLNNFNRLNDQNEDLNLVLEKIKYKKLFYKKLNFYTRANFDVTKKSINFYIFKIFVGKITKKGKKLAAFNFAYKILLKLRQLAFTKFNLIQLDGAALFFKAIKLLVPVVKIIRKKVSGNIFNLPTPLFKPKNGITIAIKNLLTNSYKRKEKGVINKIIAEIKDTLNKKSLSYLIKMQNYRVGVNNIPFLHHLNIKQYRIRYNDYKAIRFKKKRVIVPANVPNIEEEMIKLKKFTKKSYNVPKLKRSNLKYYLRRFSN